VAGKVSRSNHLQSQFTLTTGTLSWSELKRLWIGLSIKQNRGVYQETGTLQLSNVIKRSDSCYFSQGSTSSSWKATYQKTFHRNFLL